MNNESTPQRWGGLIFDALVPYMERGLTKQELMEATGLRSWQINKGLTAARVDLGDNDAQIIVDWEEHPPRYILTGDYERIVAYHAYRLNIAETHLESIHSVSCTNVNLTDGRTRQGQRARIIKTATGRLIEDLQFLLDDESMSNAEPS